MGATPSGHRDTLKDPPVPDSVESTTHAGSKNAWDQADAQNPAQNGRRRTWKKP